MNKGIIKSLVSKHKAPAPLPESVEIDNLISRLSKEVESAQMKIIRALLTELGYKVEKDKDFRHFAKTRGRIESARLPDYESKTLYIDDKPLIKWTTKIDIDFEAGKMKSTFSKPKLIG